jgi:hypothetical protein
MTQTLRQQQYGICTQMNGHVTLIDRTAPKAIVKDFGTCPNGLCLGCDAHEAISTWLQNPAPSNLN